MFDAISIWESLTARLRGIGQLLPPLILRLIMGWEFWESGWEKYHGENWFADIQEKFPFPFSVIPAGSGWLVNRVDLSAAGSPGRPCDASPSSSP